GEVVHGRRRYAGDLARQGRAGDPQGDPQRQAEAPVPGRHRREDWREDERGGSHPDLRQDGSTAVRTPGPRPARAGRPPSASRPRAVVHNSTYRHDTIDSIGHGTGNGRRANLSALLHDRPLARGDRRALVAVDRKGPSPGPAQVYRSGPDTNSDYAHPSDRPA